MRALAGLVSRGRCQEITPVLPRGIGWQMRVNVDWILNSKAKL